MQIFLLPLLWTKEKTFFTNIIKIENNFQKWLLLLLFRILMSLLKQLLFINTLLQQNKIKIKEKVSQHVTQEVKSESLSCSMIAICRYHKTGLDPGNINDIALEREFYATSVSPPFPYRDSLYVFPNFFFRLSNLIAAIRIHRHFRWIDLLLVIIYFGPISKNVIFECRCIFAQPFF